jgi:hypothetical protein
MTRLSLRVAVAAVMAATSLGLAGAAHAAVDDSLGLYGDPDAAAAFWQQQTTGDCVLMATADVVGQITGTQPSEQDIIALASSTPSPSHDGMIYTPGDDPNDPDGGSGTNGADVPTLLAHYGIPSDYTDSDRGGKDGNIASGMSALEDYLGQGRKVIAMVNAEIIWGQDSTGGSDHGLVVTGVDTANGIVHLNDSGPDDGANEQVSIETFQKAWDESKDTMTVTR